MVACKNWNDLPIEIEEFHGVQSHANVTANTWNVITYTEVERKDGGLDWLFRHASCLHCKEASCEKVCSEDAISHSKYDTVVVDEDKCVGCGYCVEYCPFDVIQLKTLKDGLVEKRKAYKCTMCIDRLDQGLQPACATACHAGSIVYGNKEELLAKAETRLQDVKDRFPNANIYNPKGVGGTNTVYLLADKPSVYGLPESPKVPTSAVVWKDYAQPLGKALLGVTTMAVVGAAISNAINNKGDGGHGHE
jgi:formate dehydrogenase iron-sulfur subunit